MQNQNIQKPEDNKMSQVDQLDLFDIPTKMIVIV